MNINYRSNRGELTTANLKELFSSVDYAACLSAEELYHAMMASTHLVTAWDGEALVGLIRSMDDGIYSANIDFLLIRPDHQRKGIAKELLKRLLTQLEAVRYLSVSPNERKNNPLYLALGFQEIEGSSLLQKENIPS